MMEKMQVANQKLFDDVQGAYRAESQELLLKIEKKLKATTVKLQKYVSLSAKELLM